MAVGTQQEGFEEMTSTFEQPRETGTVDWSAWAERWDVQQQRHIPRREERFGLMLELVAEIAGPEPRTILELACGTGSISARALQRFPGARLVALDVDPLLLAIGRGAQGNARGRLSWAEADLRDPNWRQTVEAYGPFDAVLSSTALHWLSVGDLAQVFRTLADIVREGGVFANAEHMLLAPPTTLLGPATERLRHRLTQAEARGGEGWADWWEAARTEPGFRALLEKRDGVFHDHPHHHDHRTARFQQEALRMGGFREAEVVWRYLDDTIVAAIR